MAYAFYITGQLCDILKVSFSNPFASYRWWFHHFSQHWQLWSHTSAWQTASCGGNIAKSLFFKTEYRNEKEKCCLWDTNQGPLVQHACITAHDTCLWHVGGLSNIPQTKYWVAPLVLINKLNYLMDHLLVFYIPA